MLEQNKIEQNRLNHRNQEVWCFPTEIDVRGEYSHAEQYVHGLHLFRV